MFLWEHSVFLLRALGGGQPLSQSARARGRFQEDADSSLICLWNSLYSSAFLGKNPSISGSERLLWV